MEITIKNLRYEKPQYEYQVRIDRGHSVLCNPFRMNTEAERDAVCDKYAAFFVEQINNNSEDFVNELRRLYRLAKKHGKLELFCWCVPKRCHGETVRQFLLKYLENN